LAKGAFVSTLVLVRAPIVFNNGLFVADLPFLCFKLLRPRPWCSARACGCST
jgi:hypothetical protein